jgi:hypothetical protein
MATPSSPDVRRFYTVALHRLEDATILLKNGRTTGAVYLAGYAVECILKALLLARTPAAGRRAATESFRGTKAHDFEWLRHHLRRQGIALPAGVNGSLARVRTWSTDLRYSPGVVRGTAARRFWEAAAQLVR